MASSRAPAQRDLATSYLSLTEPPSTVPRVRGACRSPQRPAGAAQFTGWSGSDNTACQVAGSVSPLGGSPRAAWNAASACTVDVPSVPSIGTVGENETRCCCSQMTSSPLEPCDSAGQPGSGTSAGGPGPCASVAHVVSPVACQLHQDRPPAPYAAHTCRKRTIS